jgi:putative transposase
MTTMLIRQGFQYALMLKPGTVEVLRRWVGCRRFVFNEALAFQNAEVAAGRNRPEYEALSARLPGLKKLYPWLKEPPAQSLQQALKDLCTAWHRTRSSGFGPPRFKRRGEGETIRFPQSCRYDARMGTIHLPKVGTVRIRHSREAVGELKNVTVRWDGWRWVASLQTEREIEVPTPTVSSPVGLDFGGKATITPSVGEQIEMPERITRYERRARRLQQQFSRKKGHSRNRAKARERIVRLHARIAAIRRDVLHKCTSELARTHALIAVEDLNVKGMTASASGTVKSPGRGVKAKSGLNRAILRNGWATARSMLEYKTAWRGATLVAVLPAYTSQTCSMCGHVAAESRKSQARFSCVACGHNDHADRNAAKKILHRAQRQLAVGAAEVDRLNCLSESSVRTAGLAGSHACDGASSPASEAVLSGSRKVAPAGDDSSVGRNHTGFESLREHPDRAVALRAGCEGQHCILMAAVPPDRSELNQAA